MNTIVFAGDHLPGCDPQWICQGAWELVYCCWGEGTVRFRDGRCLPYREGELVAIAPNEPHAYTVQEGYCAIQLNMAGPSFSYRESFKVCDEESVLYHTVLAARIFSGTDRFRKELVLSSLGELLVSYLIVFRSNAEYSEPVEQIRGEILKNFDNPDFVLIEYLRSLSFHYDYLRRLFKKEVGMSPLEYLISLRMRKAERLLSGVRSSGCAIGDVARMCGYENALYFSRVFRKYFGCSPTQFALKSGAAHPERHGSEAEKADT